MSLCNAGGRLALLITLALGGVACCTQSSAQRRVADPRSSGSDEAQPQRPGPPAEAATGAPRQASTADLTEAGAAQETTDSSTPPDRESSELSDPVEVLISEQEAEGATEYQKARQSRSGDLNGDGIEDIAVLFTIEGWRGSNVHTQYLGVVLGGPATATQKAITVVGGKLRRSVELERIDGGSVYLRTREYNPADPACCPTKLGQLECRLHADKIVCE